MKFYTGDCEHYLVKQRSTLNTDARLFKREDKVDLTEFRFLRRVTGAHLTFDEFVHRDDYMIYCDILGIEQLPEDDE